MYVILQKNASSSLPVILACNRKRFLADDQTELNNLITLRKDKKGKNVLDDG